MVLSDSVPEYKTDESGSLTISRTADNFETAQMIIGGNRVFDDIHFDNKVKYAIIQPGEYANGVDAFKKALYVGETEFDKENGNYEIDCKIKAGSGLYKLIVYTSTGGYKAYEFSHVSQYYAECNDDIKNNTSLSTEEKRKEMLEFIENYKTAFGIDTEAYTRLSDSVKLEIADAMLVHEDFTSNDDLNSFIRTYDMTDMLFATAENTDILADYLIAVAEVESGRFKHNRSKAF